MLAKAERWCSKAMAEIGRWWRNDGAMTGSRRYCGTMAFTEA
jgi:hypothetical protein